MAASPSQLPCSVPPNSEEEEEVNLHLKIAKTVALKANINSTVEQIKGLIQGKEQIDAHSLQLFFGGSRLEDGKRLVDYGIHGPPTLHGIPQTQDSARMTVNVHILSAKKNLPVEARLRDTVQDVKLIIQAKEGIAPDEFDLLFAGEVLSEDRTLASLDLLHEEPTFHLVPHPKDHLSVIVDMSGRRVTVGAKLWYSVRDIKGIVGAMMSAKVMSMHMVYQGKQLEDHKILACYDIADGSVLQLVSPSAPFQTFVKCGNCKTVGLQVSMSDTVKEVKNKECAGQIP